MVLAGSSHAKDPAPIPEIMAITGRTQGWIDPVKNRCHILRVQRADFPNSDGSDVRKAFHEAAATRP